MCPHSTYSAGEDMTAAQKTNSNQARNELASRFESRLSTNPLLSRQVVSFQGNKRTPGFRWMKYKEGFSSNLISALIDEYNPETVLDPFAGAGTTPVVAAGKGKDATGIEIMPVGVLTGAAIANAANGASATKLRTTGQAMLDRVTSETPAASRFAFPHVRITERAFPAQNETEIAKAREYLASVHDDSIRSMLDLACMSVLEDASYTRKDGQFLRWDHRSGRSLKSKADLGPIAVFHEALRAKLNEMCSDTELLKSQFGNGCRPTLRTGSCLELLKDMPSETFDLVVTSPPYANRYDYTRTYALELAWLGFDRKAFSDLRQSMLTATVENKSKLQWLSTLYEGTSESLHQAVRMCEQEQALTEVLVQLENRVHELSNKNVIRLIEGYFLEMALVVAELGRIVRPSGVVVMVNDNVQYHGEEVPVDFILGDFAEQSGFDCTNIWVLPTGKGNSSQQMARFGRRELRKCVYKWVRRDG